MIRRVADENLNHRPVRALLRRNPTLDIVRLQDHGLGGADDPAVLTWAALENRILLTHDVTTITRYAYERVEAGQRMPGGVEIPQPFTITEVVEDILLLAECSREGEWEGQILYLPLP